MAKKNALISAAYDNGTLVLNVGDAGSVSVSTNDLTDAIREKAMIHGLLQKLSDAAAMPKDQLTGDAKKDAATKLAAIQAVADRITGPDGDWNKRSGDGAGPVSGIIFRAFEEYVETMAKKRKKDAPTSDAIRARYDAMERKEQLALRNVPEIAAIIDRIKSERGSKAETVDTGSLLSELGI
jgi:hypothetical protein